MKTECDGGTGLNGQHWRAERGETGRGGGMKRWVVVSHSSPGHIGANGSLHHSDTHKHSATDTDEDMLTHFCLRGCGKPTLHHPRKRGGEGRGGGKGCGRDSETEGIREIQRMERGDGQSLELKKALNELG